MGSYIFIDENKQYTFNFNNVIWASEKLHDIYNAKIQSILSDVDFIVETEKEIIFIEYKNSDIVGASNPDAFLTR